MMKTLVVPIDFEPGTKQVLETTAELARALPARVSLIHVCDPHPEVMVGSQFATPPPSGSAAEQVNVASEKLLRTALALEQKEIPVETVVGSGTASTEIMNHAEKVGADYLVVGSHGRNVVERAVFGSVSRELLQSASCPVVVVDGSDAGP